MRPFAWAGGVTLGLLALALLAPLTACACGSSPGSACLSNVKMQGIGVLQYAADHDDRYPLRDVWADSIRPYVKREAVFHDPEAGKGAYGYASNAALSGASEPKRAARVPMVYDSLNPLRNASDRVTSLPPAGRHKGRKAVGYADGHARMIPVGTRP